MMLSRNIRLFVLLGVMISLQVSQMAGTQGARNARAAEPPFLVYLPQVLVNFSPGPQLLAEDQPHPNSLLVDSGHVYWANCGTNLSTPIDGAVMAYSRSQGDTHPLIEGLPCPSLLQVDGDSLFYFEHSPVGHLGEYVIFRLPLAGGDPQELVTYMAGNGNPAVDDTYVYWGDANGMVMRLPKTGIGAPEPAPVQTLLHDGQYAYWLEGQSTLMRADPDGSNPVTLVKSSDLEVLKGRDYASVMIMGIFPRPPDVYFSVEVNNDPGFGSCTDQHTLLLRVPRQGGAYEIIAWAGGPLRTYVVERFAYFSTVCFTQFLEVDLASHSVSPSAIWSAFPDAMADDGTYVYWADATNGWIKRILK